MRKGLRKKIEDAKKMHSQKIQSNRIYLGDNLEIMKSLESGKIDLIYIDPPFCAQNVLESKAWGKKISFNDKWGGGIHSYIKWLVPRLRQCHRLLKDVGIFVLHLDWRSVHYARVELDKIFGDKQFLNQIIWQYKTGGNSKKFFARKHDVLLIYSKSNKWIYNVQKEKSYTKAKNRQAGIVNLGQGEAEFFEDKNGVFSWINMRDVWDIPYINSQARERLGYPTQKPLALLERIVTAFTNEGNIVADFFCGCGTTLDAAQNLSRKWLGADISPDAIAVIKGRMLREHNIKVEVVDTNQLTREEIYKLKPLEFEKKMVEMLGGTPNTKQTGDRGIDGWTHDHRPIQVKMSKNVGRPVIDNFIKM